MNQSSAINIWNGTNRISRLWEDLLVDYVSPDPCAQEIKFSEGEEEHSFRSEQVESAEPGLLERAGFESLRLLRHALEILIAPPEEEPLPDTSREPVAFPDSQMELEQASVQDPIQVGTTPGLTFIKVSSEPEPQPGSSIDTRRITYGLKIPSRPLHKRPFYQRIFFCLHQMVTRSSNGHPIH